MAGKFTEAEIAVVLRDMERAIDEAMAAVFMIIDSRPVTVSEILTVRGNMTEITARKLLEVAIGAYVQEMEVARKQAINA